MIDRAELQRLVALLDGKLQMLPALDTSDRESWKAHDSAIGKIVDHLRENEGAAFRSGSGDGYRMRLAGILTSCTSGTFGLLQNWQTAAKKKIAEQRS